jgi:hypothetical protein
LRAAIIVAEVTRSRISGEAGKEARSTISDEDYCVVRGNGREKKREKADMKLSRENRTKGKAENRKGKHPQGCLRH